MAVRPVFVVSSEENCFVQKNIQFEFFSCFSETQKQKSILSLHNSFLSKHSNVKILEISSKSKNPLGIRLSAFNLMIENNNGNKFSVESAFQASKVFEHGGPYRDLLSVSSKEAKKDIRLRNSGKLIAFKISGKTFKITPKTLFYNWLYINALNMHEDLTKQIIEYDAFTDIEFNPNRSINCQAQAAAIFVSLYRKGVLHEALKDIDSFERIVYPKHNDETVGEQLSFL
jgi:hypothetical protein